MNTFERNRGLDAAEAIPEANPRKAGGQLERRPIVSAPGVCALRLLNTRLRSSLFYLPAKVGEKTSPVAGKRSENH